ncbi:hypothetical protein GGR21_004267 [Dysgonomonas hofstadii]|uniref:Uncharacterized protein n=1 Tax=Dysgonomonas hofstadii TaxID=637886 RepID=A0A840D1W5_9BACT|nr:hypothetical protein [Dysgonomonas hofstadii]MBB4038333.1 hypothetical protein [Dysgonomonas hofstadii]
MEIEDIHKQELQYILSNVLDIGQRELSKVKLLFTKAYSFKEIEKIKSILDNKLYFLLRLFSSDEFEYFDEFTGEYLFIDKMSLYYFTMDNKKYYLLFSIVLDKDNNALKKEKVEIFREK